MEVGQAEAAPLLAEADEVADDLVRGALGDALADQVLHQGRRVEVALVEPLGDPVGAEGRPVDDFNTGAFHKAAMRAGVHPLRWHDLRHTGASWAVR